MSSLSQPITIRGAIKAVRVKPKKDLRQIVISCGRSDAGRLARLSLMGAIAFDVQFDDPKGPGAAIATLRAEIESLDTRCETSERTLTISYAAADALQVAELGTYEQTEFLIMFTPAAVVAHSFQLPRLETPFKKEVREI